VYLDCLLAGKSGQVETRHLLKSASRTRCRMCRTAKTNSGAWSPWSQLGTDSSTRQVTKVHVPLGVAGYA